MVLSNKDNSKSKNTMKATDNSIGKSKKLKAGIPTKTKSSKKALSKKSEKNGSVKSKSTSIQSSKRNIASIDEESKDAAVSKQNKKAKERQDDTSEETEETTDLLEAKKKSVDLKKVVNKLYKKCIVEIKKLSEKDLPRKQEKGGEQVKVSITVPKNKKGGDMITFR